MNNVKRKNKIYYYVDMFFILLPLIIFLFGFISFMFSLNGGNQYGLDYNFYNFSHDFVDGFLNYCSYFSDSFAKLIGFDFASNSFIYYFDDFIFRIFDYFGTMNADPFLLFFIEYYLCYIVLYEFLSLFINIVLWIPRYIRSWVQEKGVNV